MIDGREKLKRTKASIWQLQKVMGSFIHLNKQVGQVCWLLQVGI
jgi:hypothetical protein